MIGNTKRYWILLITAVLTASVWADVLTLDSCMALALQNNHRLQQANLAIERAREVKNQARTKYFPQVTANAGAYHSLHPLVEVGVDDFSNASVRDLLTTLYGQYGAALGLNNTLSLFQNGYMVGVTAIQPVYMGGKIVSGNQLANLGIEAAELQQKIAERDILQEVEQSYWLVVGLEDKQQTLRMAEQLLDTIHHMVQTAVDAGVVLRTDLLQVEVQQNDLQRTKFQLQSGLRLAKRALCQSIGITMNDSLQLDTNLRLDSMAGLPTSTASPESQLLGLQVRAAELEKRMAMADALPQVALGANYGYSHLQANMLRDGLSNKTGNGALFLTVRIPLSGWWETAHRMREKQLAVEDARLEQERLGEMLSLRDEQLADDLQQAILWMELCEKSLTQSRENCELIRLNYQNGRATIQELLTAQMQLQQSQNQQTDAQIAYRVQLRRYNQTVICP